MPNTVPVNDSRAVMELILAAAEEHPVHVWPIGCVTKRQEGKELAEMGDMREAGAVAFSDDGKPVFSSLVMRKALEYSKIFGVPIIDHCEDHGLVDGGVIHEGEISTRLGLRGWPGVAEDLMVQRDILLAEYTGGTVHIAHASTARAVEFVRAAKRKKIRVTCEATPHHLLMTDEAVLGYDTNTKMNPPLRSRSDMKGLRKALADGTIDAIATDHAPHTPDRKDLPFDEAPPGMLGLETALALAITELDLPLAEIVALMSWRPAAIAGLAETHGGPLEPGRPANLCVIDPAVSWTVDPKALASRSENTPYAGRRLTGRVRHTFVAGEPVVVDAVAQR
jgi:dihydroorotase